MRINSYKFGGVGMNKFYDFNVKEIPDIKVVGGKANSLINLTKGGFNVPKGSVLSIGFFEEWIKELCENPDLDDKWHDPESFTELAKKLKEKARSLVFNESQKSIIYRILKSHGEKKLYAVRSSSPEEDLAGSSFAGGYETILGANKVNILDAVKKAFLSCMDERVFYYKHQNGFDTSVLSIAIVIQEQIASEISGVGFSLNPINNCFDEAVINANSGLGESVVSGMITPDEYVVDKVTLDLISKELGSKEQAIVLGKDGGTKVVEGKKGEFVLNSDQVTQLTKSITQIEKYYGFPIDIEWAFYNNELYILQARPITTYVPLPEEMQTTRDERPVLYLDGSLTKQGISDPISYLGCEGLTLTQKVMFEAMMGKDVMSDIKGGLGTTRGGRMYINLSNTVRFQNLKRVIAAWETVDVATTKMLKTLDLTEYTKGKSDPFMKGALWGTIKNNLGAIKYTKQALKDPDGYKAWYQNFENEYDRYLDNINLDCDDIYSKSEEVLSGFIDLLEKMVCMTYAAELSRKSIEKQLKKHFEDGERRMQYLERSLPDNITVDMGIDMYKLSKYSEIKDMSYSEFSNLLNSGKLSKTFKHEWDKYIQKYGCRTNNELDIAMARSSEKIEELFNQIKNMSDIADEFSPVHIHNESQKQREKTFTELISKLPSSAGKKLSKKYEVLVKLGGKRESLKYWYVRALTVVRKLVDYRANKLVETGILNDTKDIYWLGFNDIEKASHMSSKRVYKIIEENKKYYRILDQVSEFPRLIDSRGKILRMPRIEPKDGEISGQPISPGTVRGKVKVLKTPTEKELLPGEIMVTRATDPGWTPLFINASAIILEVGGLLQHGALVAREYGKPCIAGIVDAMKVFEDGQLIEVNAETGIIKFLKDENE